MSTVHHKPRLVKPVSGTCRWVRPICWPFPGVIEINGTPYTVLRLTGNESGPAAPALGYRLVKPCGQVWYEIDLAHQECTCPSYVWDHSRTDGRCKHIAACRVLGLLPEPGLVLAVAVKQ